MRRILGVLLCALGAIAIWPAAAPAQDGWGWSTIIPSVTGTDTLGLALRRTMQEPQPGAEAAGFRYIPSRDRRAANLAAFLDRSRAVDPQGADTLAKVFASTDVIEQMRAPLAAVGLRTDGVADAYAVYWINAWQASRGVDEGMSAAPPPRPSAARPPGRWLGRGCCAGRPMRRSRRWPRRC